MIIDRRAKCCLHRNAAIWISLQFRSSGGGEGGRGCVSVYLSEVEKCFKANGDIL
jgi:hypothetical protein